MSDYWSMNLGHADYTYMLQHYWIVYLEKLTKCKGLNNFFIEILYIASVPKYSILQKKKKKPQINTADQVVDMEAVNFVLMKHK